MNGIATPEDLAQHPLDAAGDLRPQITDADLNAHASGGREEREERHGARQ